jgi:hypothetical protein
VVVVVGDSVSTLEGGAAVDRDAASDAEAEGSHQVTVEVVERERAGCRRLADDDQVDEGTSLLSLGRVFRSPEALRGSTAPPSALDIMSTSDAGRRWMSPPPNVNMDGVVGETSDVCGDIPPSPGVVGDASIGRRELADEKVEFWWNMMGLSVGAWGRGDHHARNSSQRVRGWTGAVVGVCGVD